MPQDRNPSNRQYNNDEILGRAFHALAEQGWDAKRISDHVGMDERDVQERLSTSRSSGPGTGGTGGRGGGTGTNR